MKRWLTALGTMVMMNGACAPVVLDPAQADPSPSSSAPAPAPAGPPTALAFHYADLPPDPNLILPGPTPDPEALVLIFGTAPQSCSQPLTFAPSLEPGCVPPPAAWQALLFIPPALDRLGLVDLSDHSVLEFAQETSVLCSGGLFAGEGPPGTLDILSSDATSLDVTLSDGATAVMTVIDGSYTVERCDAEPPG
jgi:hypothetical protein